MTSPPEKEVDASAITSSAPPDAREHLVREDSLDLGPGGMQEALATEEDEAGAAPPDGTELSPDLPPGRMHATRVKQRLSGSSSSLTIPPAVAQSMLKNSRDRSKSPSIRTRDRTTTTAATPSATQTTTDANSSISSLEEIVDQDILYDRQGLVELDLSESQRKLQNSRDFGVNLQPVNERLSEETLEDVHAFSDVVRSSNASRVSISTDPVLEPLDECGEENEDELDDIDEGDETTGGAAGVGATTVILTNMENLTLQQQDRPGDSSLVGTDV